MTNTQIILFAVTAYMMAGVTVDLIICTYSPPLSNKHRVATFLGWPIVVALALLQIQHEDKGDDSATHDG